MNAEQVIAVLKKGSPDKKFGIYEGGNAIGVFLEDHGVWIPLIAKTIVGTWVKIDVVPLADGGQVWKQDKWKAVE